MCGITLNSHGGLKMRKRILITVSLTLAFVLIVAAQSYALVIHFNLSRVDVAVGSSFNVEMFADIGSDEQLLGWDIDFDFDNTQMTLDSIMVGSNWVEAPTPLPDDDVSVAGLAPFGLPPGTGIWGENLLLATISFNCIAEGNSKFDITMDDPKEGFALITPGAFASWSSKSIDINQVAAPIPEPGTWVLLSMGFVGLAGVYRKRSPEKK
ncbi:MAG: PEP-CTERM sorting domain-containing protein [Desulfobacteraceae bacterium]|nr:PEP-CTERM sorting domain-containing protein [Desulfobacteraceae bacterium]